MIGNLIVDFTEESSKNNLLTKLNYIKKLMPSDEDIISDLISDADTDIDAANDINGFAGYEIVKGNWYEKCIILGI